MRFSYGCIIIVLFLSVVLFAQNPPRELYAESNLDAHIELSWLRPIEEIGMVEIAYDDGGGGGIDEADVHNIVSVRFTPTARCSLLQTRLMGYVIAPGGMDVIVELSVMADNGAGRPDIYSEPLYTAEHILENGWQVVDLYDTSLGIDPLVFDSGEDFHICIEKTIHDTIAFNHIIHDNDPVPEGRSWLYVPPYIEAVPGDLHIRAMVFYEGRRFARLPADAEKIVTPFGLDPFIGDNPFKYESRVFEITEDVDEYIIYRGTEPDTVEFDHIDSVEDTFFTDYLVTNDVTYYYGIKARYEGGEVSDFSNIVFATPRVASSTSYLDTIILDDGLPNATASYSYGNGFGTRLQFPCTGILHSLLYYFNAAGQFRPQVWTIDNDGLPDEIRYAGPWLDVDSLGWRTVNISASATVVLEDTMVAACVMNDYYIGIGVDIPGRTQSYDYGGDEWSSVADSSYMIRAVVEYHDDAAYYNIKGGSTGWNFVSVPVLFDDNSVSSVFPTALGGEAFVLESEFGAFSITTEVEPGKAYYIRSSDGDVFIDTSYVVQGGIPARTLDIPIKSGWNYIGGTANPCGHSIYSDIETFPEGILYSTPYVYWYNPELDSNVQVDRIMPGKGYFVLSWGDGILRLN